jgi:hypothetical protein
MSVFHFLSKFKLRPEKFGLPKGEKSLIITSIWKHEGARYLVFIIDICRFGPLGIKISSAEESQPYATYPTHNFQGIKNLAILV